MDWFKSLEIYLIANLSHLWHFFARKVIYVFSLVFSRLIHLNAVATVLHQILLVLIIALSEGLCLAMHRRNVVLMISKTATIFEFVKLSLVAGGEGTEEFIVRDFLVEERVLYLLVESFNQPLFGSVVLELAVKVPHLVSCPRRKETIVLLVSPERLVVDAVLFVRVDDFKHL